MAVNGDMRLSLQAISRGRDIASWYRGMMPKYRETANYDYTMLVRKDNIVLANECFPMLIPSDFGVMDENVKEEDNAVYQRRQIGQCFRDNIRQHRYNLEWARGNEQQLLEKPGKS